MPNWCMNKVEYEEIAINDFDEEVSVFMEDCIDTAVIPIGLLEAAALRGV